MADYIGDRVQGAITEYLRSVRGLQRPNILLSHIVDAVGKVEPKCDEEVQLKAVLLRCLTGAQTECAAAEKKLYDK